MNAFAGITMRNTDDHRILIRQGLNYRPSQRITSGEHAKVQRQHKVLFDDRLPMLKAVELEHTWSGFVCLSRNGTPDILPPRPFLDIGLRSRFQWGLFTNRHEA